MKYKHIAIVFIIGVIFFIPGAVFTYLNWEFSSAMLITGSALKLAAVVMLIIRLVDREKKKRILK